MEEEKINQWPLPEQELQNVGDNKVFVADETTNMPKWAKVNKFPFAKISDLTTHINDSIKHITDGERITWNGKASGNDLTTHINDKKTHFIELGDLTQSNINILDNLEDDACYQFTINKIAGIPPISTITSYKLFQNTVKRNSSVRTIIQFRFGEFQEYRKKQVFLNEGWSEWEEMESEILAQFVKKIEFDNHINDKKTHFISLPLNANIDDLENGSYMREYDDPSVGFSLIFVTSEYYGNTYQTQLQLFGTGDILKRKRVKTGSAWGNWEEWENAINFSKYVHIDELEDLVINIINKQNVI